jgi:activator of HSP90 ATPase
MSSASSENASADGSSNVMANVRIDAAPEVVFPYLTDASLVVRWIGDWAELDPVPGGLFALNVESAVARGTFLVVEPPRRVVFSWGSPWQSDDAIRLDYRRDPPDVRRRPDTRRTGLPWPSGRRARATHSRLDDVPGAGYAI